MGRKPSQRRVFVAAYSRKYMKKSGSHFKPRRKPTIGHLKLLLIITALLVTGLIGSLYSYNTHNKKTQVTSSDSSAASTGCNPLISSSCTDISNTQGVPIEHWQLSSQSVQSGTYNSNTQISSCEYDAENPPRSSLPAGQISPAEKGLQDKARTFQSADAFNSYIQSLNETNKHRAICIFDGWTASQFYNDAISRR
jgi:hypothetical protein